MHLVTTQHDYYGYGHVQPFAPYADNVVPTLSRLLAVPYQLSPSPTPNLPIHIFDSNSLLARLYACFFLALI
jgi:hypothetical protein